MGNSVTIRKNQFKESADTVTFDIFSQGEKKQGFLVWFEGVFKAYVNQCRHMEVCLDWQPNDFFDEDSIDGALVGGASLDANIFANIVNIYKRLKKI